MKTPYSIPPLLNLPQLAPITSACLVVAFLIAGMNWAYRSRDRDVAFGVLMCVIIAISPLSWDHYYVLIIIPLIILWRNLAKLSFPLWQSLVAIIITLLLLLFNEHIETVTIFLNGGKGIVEAAGNHLSFISSILFWLPILEVISLTILLWKSRMKESIYETYPDYLSLNKK